MREMDAFEQAYKNGYAAAEAKIVRCKDCKHWEDGWLGCCTKLHTVIPYDGFCSYGERRTV